MSPLGAIFVPFPPKTGTNMLRPLPLQSLNLSNMWIPLRTSRYCCAIHAPRDDPKNERSGVWNVQLAAISPVSAQTLLVIGDVRYDPKNRMELYSLQTEVFRAVQPQTTRSELSFFKVPPIMTAGVCARVCVGLALDGVDGGNYSACCGLDSWSLQKK